MSFKKLDFQTGYSGLTNADIALFLKRTLTTDEESLIDDLITEIERDICRETSRQFNSTVEYYEEFGSGFNKFDFYNLPIASLEKVEVDNVETTGLVEGTDYWIIDELYLRFATSIASQNVYTGVKLTYKIRQFWGEDIELLIKKMVSVEFLRSEDGGVALGNFSFSDTSQQFNQAQFEKQKQKVLDYYTSHQL